jgi:xanthine/uracil/vitamin C permease (AzgA family)
MLTKLKQLPLEVLLAILVLFLILVFITWNIPGAIIALVIVAATGWSILVLLEYFIGL